MKRESTVRGAHTKVAGYTILDVMVVTLIIGVLASIGLNRYNLVIARSKRPAAVMAFRTLAVQQREYRLTQGQYADTFDKLGFNVEGGLRISPTEIQGRRYNYRLIQDAGPHSWYCIASGNIDGDPFKDIIGASNPR